MTKEQAKNQLQIRRNRAQSFSAQRRQALIQNDAAYQKLLTERQDITMAILAANRAEEDAAPFANRLMEIGQALDARLSAILQEQDLEADYLLPPYQCAICGDTGLRPDGEACTCYAQLLMQGKPYGVDQEPEFSAFLTDIFPQGAQRDAAVALKNELEQYAHTFGKGARNILLQGEAGLGKSFLLGCTARAISQRGFSVHYLTAYDMLELFKKKHLKGEETITPLMEVDFLIIDDLGTESMMQNITVEYLLAILNRRGTNGLPTAIATNLSPSQLKKHYGERIFSRISGYALARQLKGKDLRFLI
ncbi:ATP-binding protein [Eubacteriales bacterium OttesenSCG-928-M02]|nr:ATP-binding protein [Eubacteriales bacterium OttesenSCG-928-M02]